MQVKVPVIEVKVLLNLIFVSDLNCMEIKKQDNFKLYYFDMTEEDV